MKIVFVSEVSFAPPSTTFEGGFATNGRKVTEKTVSSDSNEELYISERVMRFYFSGFTDSFVS